MELINMLGKNMFPSRIIDNNVVKRYLTMFLVPTNTSTTLRSVIGKHQSTNINYLIR